MQLHNAVGILGVLLILAAYFLLQAGRFSRDVLWYSAMNGLGSAFILCSLWFEFNLPSALVEGAWLVVSLYGVVRWYRARGAGR